VSEGLPAKEPDVAGLVPFEGAVDHGDRSCLIDGELVHQQSLLTAVDAKGRIGAARHDRGRRKGLPAATNFSKQQEPFLPTDKRVVTCPRCVTIVKVCQAVQIES